MSITDIVKEEPTPRRRAPRRRPVGDSANDTTADRLERAAQVTGDWQPLFAWMDIRTVTGKLTFGAWVSRWWASGSYMRRRLVVSFATAAVTTALIALLVFIV